MKKRIRTRFKGKGKRKNLKQDHSKKILIIFSLIVLMLIISMIISFLTEKFYKEGDLNQYAGDLGSSGIFKVNNPYPSGNMVSFFVGENKTFNISNNNYQRIEWYLDEKNIKNDSKSLEIIGKVPGNYTLMVKIINGSQVDSRIWKIEIYDSEKQIKFVFDTGSVMFWVILIILLIIMGLVVWLLIKEHLKRKRRIKLEVKVIGEEESKEGFMKKKDMSKRFNIPGN